MVSIPLISKKNIVIFFILFGKFLFSQSYIPDSIANATIDKQILKKYKKFARRKKIKLDKTPKVFKIFWTHYKNDSSENLKYVLNKELLEKNIVFNSAQKNNILEYDCYGFIYNRDSLYVRFDELGYFYRPNEKYINLLHIILTYKIKYAFRIANVGYECPVFLVNEKGKIYVFYTEKYNTDKTIYILKKLSEYKPICCLDLFGRYK